jgi:hypothetical protein
MPRFPGPHNEPGRKTDYYMPRDNAALDDYTFLEHVDKKRAGPKAKTSAVNAYQESFKYALRGERHPTQISCLRGTLRKAVIQLAADIRDSDAQPELAQRQQTRIKALEKMLDILQGYRVVSEERDGQTVWCRRIAK